ncbi:MAG: hypothetical protein E6Y21_00745 [Cutibacterium avidum]|nr:hypothetical protein [Cutibacterium avidum]MDU5547337.1 hypothetical protein [Cutibacterium avidum]
MRIRSMKPEYWSSPDVSHMSLATRLVFPGLWSLADDEGRFLADARWIRSQIFPMDEHVGEDSVIIHGGLSEDSVSIHGVLTELSNGGQITLYRAGRDHRLYGQVVNWAHQRINRPTRSRIPPLTSDDEIETDPFSESSVSPHGALTEDSLQEQGNKGTREQGNGGSRRCGGDDSSTDLALVDDTAPADAVASPTPKTKRGSRLPDGWQPERSDANLAAEASFDAAWLGDQLNRFRDYWTAVTGAKGTKLDWDATWRNWIRRSGDERSPKRRGNGPDWNSLMAHAASDDHEMGLT